MAKVQRRLWELNNYYAEFWKQPLAPEPEGGFADEPQPPGLDDVVDWFRKAVPAKHHSKIPAAMGEIERIAWLIAEWRLQAEQPPAPNREILINSAHALPSLVAKLKTALRPVVDDLRRHSPDPGGMQLVNLWEALCAAEPYVGTPAGQGRPAPVWHTYVGFLEKRARAAFEIFGVDPSPKENGRLIKIIQPALVTLEIDQKPSAIASALKKHHRREGKTI